MPTFTEILPAQKSGTAGIRWVPLTASKGVLSIDTKRGSAAYIVSEVPTSYAGRTFRFDCAGGQSDPEATGYAVFCGHDGKGRCGCKGYTFGKGKPCRHILAAQALWDNGWIDLGNPDADAGGTE